MKAFGKLAVGVLWVADFAVSVWCLGVIWFLRAVPSPAVRLTLIALFAGLTLAVLVGTFRKRRILPFGLLLPIGFVAGWLKPKRPDETFAEMRERRSVNKYVKDVKDMSDYSRRLRTGF